MPNMQVTVGFRWKTRNNAFMLAGFEITQNDIAYKITDRWILIVSHCLGLLNNSMVNSDEEYEFYRITTASHYD